MEVLFSMCVVTKSCATWLMDLPLPNHGEFRERA